MGPLVIKERFKETRVYRCGNTEAWYDKGQDRRAQIIAQNRVLLKRKNIYIYRHTHQCGIYIKANGDKITGST